MAAIGRKVSVLQKGVACSPAAVDNSNVAQAELDLAGPEFGMASKQINAAAVEIHRIAKWSAAEMERIGEVQNWIASKR